jgi:hypothetical protein
MRNKAEFNIPTSLIMAILLCMTCYQATLNSLNIPPYFVVIYLPQSVVRMVALRLSLPQFFPTFISTPQPPSITISQSNRLHSCIISGGSPCKTSLLSQKNTTNNNCFLCSDVSHVSPSQKFRKLQGRQKNR